VIGWLKRLRNDAELRLAVHHCKNTSASEPISLELSAQLDEVEEKLHAAGFGSSARRRR
jgi:hypothetical protein